MSKCDICGSESEEQGYCMDSALCKATEDDHFGYLVGLTTGHIIEVVGVTIVGDGRWVNLRTMAQECEDQQIYEDREKLEGYACPRGISVRRECIAFVVDAPNGS